jgi:hypothetical protein
VESHYVFYGIVEREVGCVRCRYLAQSSGHRRKQFWQVVVVDHKVRHLKKSFVALKISVRIEMTLRTQSARVPTPSRSKREDHRGAVESANTFWRAVPISGKNRGDRSLPGRLWNSVFGKIPCLSAEFLE